MGTRAELDAAVAALAGIGRVVYRGEAARLTGNDTGRYRTYTLIRPAIHPKAPADPEAPAMTPLPLDTSAGPDEPQSPKDNPRLAAALACARRGWYVFPLHPGTKRPASPDHAKAHCDRRRDPRCRNGHVSWEERATIDTGRIVAYWSTHPDHNIGIAAGRSGLVVIDCDTPKHPGDNPPPPWNLPGIGCGEDVLAVLAEQHGGSVADMFATFLVRTGRGGLHAYYQHPSAGTRLRNTQDEDGNGIGWKIDTRSHGGSIVAPGSTVNGRTYAVLHDVQPAPLPEWLAGLLTPDTQTTTGSPTVVSLPGDRRARYLAAALDRETAHVRDAPANTHNRALYTASLALGRLVATGALDETIVRDALADAARHAGSLAGCDCTPQQIHATITSGLTAGAKNPRAVAA